MATYSIFTGTHERLLRTGMDHELLQVMGILENIPDNKRTEFINRIVRIRDAGGDLNDLLDVLIDDGVDVRSWENPNG